MACCCCGNSAYFEQDENNNNGKRNEIVVKERTCTDLPFLYIMGIYMCVNALFVGYCAYHSDLHRLMTPGITKNVTSEGIHDYDPGKDLYNSWDLMICLTLTAVGYRYAIKCIIWTVIASIVIVSLILAVTLWFLYTAEKQLSFLVLAIIFTLIALAACAVAYFMRRRIEMVVALFHEASKALAYMPCLLAQPFLTFLASCPITLLHFVAVLLIESSGRLATKEDVAVYEKDAIMQIARYTNILSFFWCSLFIAGCQHMTVAGAVARWYFVRDKHELRRPICTSGQTLINYHLGTVAFGSLIIALVKLLRVLLEQLESEVEKDPDNQIAVMLLKCCTCLMGLCESALQYLTLNAYIETSISGVPFCEAGKRAFQLISANVLNIAAINSLGSCVLCVGKLVVVGLTIGAGLLLFRLRRSELEHPIVPIILVALFAFLIANAFLSVYELCIDALFICFCKDCEINDGSSSHPYYMGTGLMLFVNNTSNQMKEEQEEKRLKRLN